jgi:hypothetical protein
LTIEAKKKFIITLAISTHVSQSSIGLAVTVISKSAMFSMERYEGMLAKGTGTATWIIQTAPMDQVTSPQEHVHGWHFHSDWNGIELLCITLWIFGPPYSQAKSNSVDGQVPGPGHVR